MRNYESTSFCKCIVVFYKSRKAKNMKREKVEKALLKNGIKVIGYHEAEDYQLEDSSILLENNFSIQLCSDGGLLLWKIKDDNFTAYLEANSLKKIISTIKGR